MFGQRNVNVGISIVGLGVGVSISSLFSEVDRQLKKFLRCLIKGNYKIQFSFTESTHHFRRNHSEKQPLLPLFPK